MVPEKDLLKEVTQELWQSVNKLRPGLPKEARMQLVLKALITIGDLPNPIEAAMVVGTCLEMEGGEEEPPKQSNSEASTDKGSKVEEAPDGRRIVRRRSAAN
ncbi:TIGR03894 family protein [Prochlorococcus sp. MIT 1341]|uniref:TIGR03894 family protein n=1 Tax=Prochlorococcus sp. MIT 1341 TaxID=3096221 RepID=UPI002A7650AA|nr:TIGR03894 family protein [Prochlorococcus sp. MIT 1341]